MLNKIIKKTTRLVSYLLVLVTVIPMLTVGLLRLPGIQDYVVSKVLSKISEVLGTEINYSDVNITTFNRIRFDDLYIADQHDDTLIYSGNTLIVTPVIFNFLIDRGSENVTLKKMVFDDALFRLAWDSTGTPNLQFIIDYLNANRKPDKEKKPIRIKNISIADSRFYLQNPLSPPDSTGIAFGNMRLNNLNLNVDNIVVFGDTIDMDIDPLRFKEQSSFEIEELTGHMKVCTSLMQFSDTKIITPRSNLDVESITLDYESFKDFSPDSLFRKVDLNLRLRQSRLDLYDVGFFADFFADYSQSIDLTGYFYGAINNLKGRQLLMGWGSSSFLSGNFSINGLPNVSETFLIFDLSELVTSVKDIENLELPGNRYISLPDQISHLTDLRYKGNFTGFLNDFVANGKLTTTIGSVYTDIMFTPDTAKSIRFSGNVKTQNFQLGKLLDQEELFQNISINAGITGRYSETSPLIADIKGEVGSFGFKNYPYRNIRINGILSNKKFNGELNVNDPNLIMNFQGLIDMESAVREYDFNVNLIDANLYALHISDTDPEYHASFLLSAKAQGASLDEMNGEFNLLNSLFSKTSKQIQVYDFSLQTKNTESQNEILITSDILDATISGQFRLSELKSGLITYLRNYIPALIPESPSRIDTLFSPRINFTARFKQTQALCDFFFPEYLIGENSELTGRFAPGKNQYLNLTFIAPELKYKSNHWDGFVLNIDSEDTLLTAMLGSQNFSVSERIDLENFTLEAQAHSDRVNFNTRWLNWDSTLYRGAISGDAIFRNIDNQRKMNFYFNPTTITLSDTVWSIEQFSLFIDTAGVGVSNLFISKKDQSILADGRISDVPGDSLQFEFRNFELSNLNFLLRRKDFELAGALNGNGNITGKKINPLFFSSLNITELVVNEVHLGDCYINSLWNNRRQSLNINAEAQRGKLTMLKIEGDYFPTKNGKMDFQIKLDKLKTNILNPFMNGVFTDIRGLASGELQLSGFKDKPSLSGRLNLQKNAFTIDYLKTRYNFTSEVEIANNNFILNNIELFDKDGNHAIVNGMVRTEYLKNFNLNLGINIRNMLCMDTRETDNNMFYGTAYGTGDIRIRGEPSTLRFNINAETGKNTHISIPLSQSAEVSEYNFVTFIRSDTSRTKNVKVEQTQQVDLTGIQMDFNLKVTPDAEVQIIFDPTLGDIIKARGNGDMHLSINTLGTFDMVGEYVIEKGDYLFTLQNVINKRLKIEEGSTLRWTGDPFNAYIDVVAVYRTKADPSPLLGLSPSEGPGRMTVDCRIFLKDLLMSPNIKYDLYMPFSDQDYRDRVNSKIQSEEELTKQFLALMVMGSFIAPSSAIREGEKNSSENLGAGMNNASELLSNQLSNWLSQISNDFDLGFTYRPGQEVDAGEVELALSTQLLNDRLSIDGSIDMKTNAEVTSKSKFAGDFDVDYKLNKKGNIRLRAFNRSNDDLTEHAPNTQGVGFFFKQEFDTFGELMDRYWATLTGRKKPRPGEADVETN